MPVANCTAHNITYTQDPGGAPIPVDSKCFKANALEEGKKVQIQIDQEEVAETEEDVRDSIDTVVFYICNDQPIAKITHEHED